MKMTKIRLINWHQFWDNVIEINHNTLLTGNNGSGKSTLLDAIFFVLSGGESKRFNKAANNESERTLESYMRGKLGNEGTDYLRSVEKWPDIISHIALEFKEENSDISKIIGCVLEINGAGNPRIKFYSLDNISIEKLKLINNNQISTDNELRNYYGAKLFDGMNASKKKNRENIAKVLGLNRNAGEKYYQLLSKAVAFRPIQSNVSQFVNDFLLKENHVNIDSLQNELRSYKEITDSILREKRKKELLDGFIDKAEKYQNNLLKIEYLDIIKLDYESNRLDLENQKIEKNIDKKNFKIKSLEDRINRNSANKNEIENVLRNLKNNDNLVVYNKTKSNLEKLEVEFKECSNIINKLELDFSKEYKTMQILGLHFDFKRDINEKNIELLNEHINEYIKRKNELDDLLRERNAAAKDKISQYRTSLSSHYKDLDRLEKNLNNYDRKLNDLIEEIKEAISKNHNNHKDEIFIKPICECIDIKEQEWANAIEGYLNTQRFDLIIEEKYYQDAVRITDKHKDLMYGIVDVKHATGKVEKDSLYEKITVQNHLVDGIMKCILGKVICVNNIDELNKYTIAISKSCMIYKNYIARNLHKKAYEIPYIGENARIKRMEILRNEIKNLNITISTLETEIGANEQKLGLIKESLINNPITDNYWAIKDDLSIKISEQTNRIMRLSNDKNIESLIKEIEKVEKEVKDICIDNQKLEYEKNNLHQSIGSDKTKKDTNLSNLNGLKNDRCEKVNKIKNKNHFEEFAKKYRNNDIFNVDYIRKDYESMKNYNNSQKQFIERCMNDYTNQYSKNLFADINNINDFISEYNKLKERDIPSLEIKAKKILEETKRNFNDNFISVIREKIKEGIEELKNINKNLKSHPFGNLKEVYEFVWRESGDQEMREYYRIITSGKDIEKRDLFTETLNQKDLDIINRLFDKLANSEVNQEKNISKYLDYRSYLSYDIVIKYGNGDSAYFSKICKEKSGGETQTPFYVIMGSCFNELINNKDNGNNSCLVIFDEAFNNMDELRIQSLMDFYKTLDLQIILAVPTNRCHTLTRYVDSAIAFISSNNNITTHNLFN